MPASVECTNAIGGVNPTTVESLTDHVLIRYQGGSSEWVSCEVLDHFYFVIPENQMSAEDYQELAPLLILLFVAALGVKLVKDMFLTPPGRN